MRRDLRVSIESLGTWGSARLVAEYDPESETIRVDARAVENVRRSAGDAEARRFIACAVAHELAHRAIAGRSEDEAHAVAARACGTDPRSFEALVRG